LEHRAGSSAPHHQGRTHRRVRSRLPRGGPLPVRLHVTTSLCALCAKSLPAEIRREGDRILLSKVCPDHGPQEAVLASDAEWYLETVRELPHLEAPAHATRPATQGCPFDCGTCVEHEQRVHLPVLPITSACNLECPICYTHNKSEGAYHMAEDELRAILGHLRRAAPDRRVINLTGGEPTLHPHIVRLVEMCRDEGLKRLTISTHRLTFLKYETMLQRLGELGARIVLSFDSLKEEPNRALLGAHP